MILAVTSGCSGPAAPEAEAVAEALARRVRLFYEQRLASEEGEPPPDPSRAQAAQVRLEAALEAAELDALPAEITSATSWGAAAARARNLLLAHDYVFLPVSPGDVGLALAKVEARETGLQARLWGKTVRYRRVEHAAPLLTDYTTYRSLRTGRPPLPPAARLAGPTVFLDRSAIARRAGRGPYAGATAASLSAHLELAQIAGIRFSDEVRAEELDVPGRGPALVEALIRVWLTLLHHGEGDLAAGRLAWEVAQPAVDSESPWRVAARWISARLREGDDPRELSPRLLQALGPR